VGVHHFADCLGCGLLVLLPRCSRRGIAQILLDFTFSSPVGAFSDIIDLPLVEVEIC
jgi:hypothetical protein